MSDARLPRVGPDDLADDQRAVYDELAGGRRASGPFRLVEADGSLTGPFGAMVAAPSVGGALGRLGAAIRYESGLTDRVREIVILAAAVHRQSEFEWYAHERVGAAAGLDADDLAALRAGDADHWTDPAEQLAHQVTLAALTSRRLPDELFATARDVLGLAGLIEVLVTVGYYDALALLLSSFEIGLPDDEQLSTSL